MSEEPFRPMRRSQQQMDDSENRRVLTKMTSGVLALQVGNGGYPYAVPLSYVLHDNVLYFHSAVEGHKIEAVKRCGKASFCVIEQDQVLAEKFTTAYRSVIVFGDVCIVQDEAERRLALKLLAEKYSPGVSQAKVNNNIETGLKRVAILRFEIIHLTGKQGRQTIEMAKISETKKGD